MKTYAGIDSGQCGALAIIDDDLDILALEDWPVDIESAAAVFRSLFLEHQPTLVCLEHITAMPKQAVLVGLDSEEAGAKAAWSKWVGEPPNSFRLPPVGGRDPTEMHLAGIKLHDWISLYLSYIAKEDYMQKYLYNLKIKQL